MSVNTVIFDLDGTLLYTLEDLTDSMNYVLEQYGYPQKTTDEIKNAVGNGVSLLVERVIPDGRNNQNFLDCIESFKKIYSENMFNKTKPYEGIIDLLKTLKSKNYNIGVVSNKFDSAVNELCKRYFEDLIDISVGQSQDTKPKPAPDGINKILSALDVTNNNCIYVGDSEVDIQTANNTDILCLSVVWGYKDLDFLYKNGAGNLIYFPEDILEFI